MIDSKKYYPFLDVLRGISILWVVFHHAHNFLNIDRFDLGTFDFLIDRTARLGFLGVDIFFVTSGFLITGLLIDEFYEGNIRIGRFYGRRFFKIWPHYFFYFLLTLFFLHLLNPAPGLWPLQILGYLLLFQNYLTGHIQLLEHTWSIAIEEHFYLIYPLLLGSIAAFAKSRSAKFKSVFFCMLFLMLLGNLFRYKFFIGDPIERALLNHQTHIRFDALIFGCLIRFCEPILIRPSIAKYLSSGCFCLALILYADFFINYDHAVWFSSTLAYFGSGLLIVAGLNHFRLFTDLSRNRFLLFVGRSSYGIYLAHYIILHALILFLGDTYKGWTVYFVYIIVSIASGLLTTVTLERYFINLRKICIP